MKRNFIVLFIILMVFFFFYNFSNVKASEIVINEYPVSSDIVYGEPLFESKLVGGKASVEGTFSWKNDREIFEVGVYDRIVVFTPEDVNYSKVEFFVSVNVKPRRVYINFEKAIYKQYDGSTDISLPSYVVLGIIDKTVYISGKLKATLNSVLIGESSVNLEGLEIKGEKKENYYLDLTGFSATVHPSYVEDFLSSNHRIEFGENIYVPIDSVIYVEKEEDFELRKNNYEIKEVYDVYLKSNDNRLEVNDEVVVKLKIDEGSLKYKRIEVYNYFNGEYEEIDYKYKDGYIVYKTSSLGKLVIAQRKLNFMWLYILVAVLIFVIGVLMTIKIINGREKINKYKSLRRKNDNGYC